MRQRMIGFLAIGLLLLAVPQLGFAGDKPVYTYLEAGYNEVDIDNLGNANDEGNGAYAGVSIGFFKNFHAFGRYVANDTDLTNADITTTFVGAGWHGLLGDKADLIGEAAWIDSEIDAGSQGKIDESGYFARVGARWRPIKMFEVGGWARYQDLGDNTGTPLDSDATFEANAMVHFWRIAVGLAAEFEDDVETYSAFARFNFGG